MRAWTEKFAIGLTARRAMCGLSWPHSASQSDAGHVRSAASVAWLDALCFIAATSAAGLSAASATRGVSSRALSTPSMRKNSRALASLQSGTNAKC